MDFWLRKPNKNIKQQIRDLLSFYDANVVFKNEGWSCCAYWDSTIYIHIREWSTCHYIWSEVFHELAHILCYRYGKFKKYHASSKLQYHNNILEHSIYVRKNGLRAEIYVDKLGKELMHIHYPDIPYISSYETEFGKREYKKWLNKNYPI